MPKSLRHEYLAGSTILQTFPLESPELARAVESMYISPVKEQETTHQLYTSKWDQITGIKIKTTQWYG